METSDKIKKSIAFKFQTELQRSYGINYTVDIKDIVQILTDGFNVRILKDGKPIEAIPIYTNIEMKVGDWTAMSELSEHERDIDLMLCTIVNKDRL